MQYQLSNAITLNQADFEALCQNAQDQGEMIHQCTEFGSILTLPRVMGKGSDRLIQLRGGLTIHIRDSQLQRTVVFEQEHGETFPLVAKFYLSGASRVKTEGAPEIIDDYLELTGHSYLYHLPALKEREEWCAETLQVVMIYASVDYFRSFSTNNDVLPYPLQRLMQDAERFHQPLGKMPPAMMQILQHLLHCPYQGFTQQLYLESKALELLSLQFACLDADLSNDCFSPLKAYDLEMVRYARDILVQQLDCPPSLLELAHQVGLNDRKLKQGFRQLFGTTVFGYLRDYRMQQARHLLQHSEMTVAQVAAQVGYRNPEAFSTAFRRKFALSPKAYQLGRCG